MITLTLTNHELNEMRYALKREQIRLNNHCNANPKLECHSERQSLCVIDAILERAHNDH